MRINFVLNQWYQNFSGEIAKFSGRKQKNSILRRNPFHIVEEASEESNIENLWKDHFSAITNSVGFTDNRDQVMNALGTLPDHNNVINVHELRQIVRGLKNKKAFGNDEIIHEVYKFASERLLTMMSIFLSGCMLTGKLPNSLMNERSDHSATEMQIKRSSRCQQLQANCNCHSPLQGT